MVQKITPSECSIHVGTTTDGAIWTSWGETRNWPEAGWKRKKKTEEGNPPDPSIRPQGAHFWQTQLLRALHAALAAITHMRYMEEEKELAAGQLCQRQTFTQSEWP